MTRLESIQEIKDTAIRLQETLLEDDIESIRMAEEAFISSLIGSTRRMKMRRRSSSMK